MNDLPYATNDDIVRCTDIVKNELAKIQVNMSYDRLHKIALEIMGISYAHGGDYSNNIIEKYAKVYVKRNMYKKYQ